MIPLVETRHRSFNPVPFTINLPSALSGICSEMEKDGWELVKIIPNTQFESIAIFQRLSIVQEEETAVEEDGHGQYI